MTDSDQAVPETPGYDPKNFSEGATSYVIKAAAAEDGEREGKTKPLEDPGAEVEESGKWRVVNLLNMLSSTLFICYPFHTHECNHFLIDPI